METKMVMNTAAEKVYEDDARESTAMVEMGSDRPRSPEEVRSTTIQDHALRSPGGVPPTIGRLRCWCLPSPLSSTVSESSGTTHRGSRRILTQHWKYSCFS